MSKLKSSRSDLYRATVWHPSKSVAFIEASTREQAIRKLQTTLAVLYQVTIHEAAFESVASCAELVGSGISGDEDLRVFGTGWSGVSVTTRALRPLFLTNNAVLLCRWVELCSSLAANHALERTRANQPGSLIVGVPVSSSRCPRVFSGQT